MAYSDYAVLDTIRRLSASQQRITYDDIVACSGIPRRTVERAVKRLENEQKITLSGSGRGKPYEGYIIEIANPQ